MTMDIEILKGEEYLRVIEGFVGRWEFSAHALERFEERYGYSTYQARRYVDEIVLEREELRVGYQPSTEKYVVDHMTRHVRLIVGMTETSRRTLVSPTVVTVIDLRQQNEDNGAPVTTDVVEDMKEKFEDLRTELLKDLKESERNLRADLYTNGSTKLDLMRVRLYADKEEEGSISNDIVVLERDRESMTKELGDIVSKIRVLENALLVF